MSNNKLCFKNSRVAYKLEMPLIVKFKKDAFPLDLIAIIKNICKGHVHD